MELPHTNIQQESIYGLEMQSVAEGVVGADAVEIITKCQSDYIEKYCK